MPDEIDPTSADAIPVPIQYIDVERITITSLNSLAETNIKDFYNIAGPRALSEPWTGKTVFDLLKPAPPAGQVWILGELKRKVDSTRPENCRIETWQGFSKPRRRKEIKEWEEFKAERQKARDKRCFPDIIADEKEYDEKCDAARLKLRLPDAPAMPCQLNPKEEKQMETSGLWICMISTHQRSHQDHIGDVGKASEDYHAMVHTPIDISKAMKIPKAKEAVDAEWNKLIKKKAWLYSTVRPRREVQDQAIAEGREVHFGTLMDLCHLKHSELAEHFHVYKGRVVFRGDQVKDESGYYAVFSEQGTSASQMAAAKTLDAMARMPGMDGENSDAVGAYTQVPLIDQGVLLGKGKRDYIETWISLPRNRRPQEWDQIEDPVCLLRLNLYGHPLAGLLWEKHCEDALFSFGFQRVKGWECFYVHKKEQFKIQIYVDEKTKDSARLVSRIEEKLRDQALYLAEIIVSSNVQEAKGRKYNA